MLFEFHGAARGVTGSSHILQVNGSRILLECGLHQGKRKEAFERNRSLSFRPEEIHNVVLSHAHIDHSGNLPQLVKCGFRGRIFATRATQDLATWMLRDSAHIQEKDVEYVNKKRRAKGQNPFEPLYTMPDADRCLEHFEGIPYGHAVVVAPGVSATFEDAGHMLGSAVVHLEVTEGRRRRKVVFTGDVGRKGTPIIRDPVPPVEADVLLSECTYGSRLHDREKEVREVLRDLLAETFSRRGRVLIPAFSVGRTQTLVYHLHRLYEERLLPPEPIYVDSPLAVNATEVFRAHPECYDEETLRFLANDADPFGFRLLTYVRSLEESKALNDAEGPCVIISASGMMESGRVLHHLKRVAPDPRNSILIVGYMAENTLGRRVEERVPEIRVFGEEFPLRAEVHSVPGLSGHADRQELLEFLGHLRRPPEVTFLVHGEESEAFSLAEALRKRGFPRVEIPKPHEKFRI